MKSQSPVFGSQNRVFRHWRLSVAMALAGLCVQAASGATVVLECEQFDSRGGWSLDSQFLDEMGSSYLLAHGLGRSVADASTTFDVAEAGSYDVWVRTKNWVAPWYQGAQGAGSFQLAVNGTLLPTRLGGQGRGEWLWVKAGSVSLSAGRNALALKDGDGFDGRCDAIVLTTEREPDCERLRRECEPRELAVSQHDLVVVGGGIAGICTAVSAARLGLEVALVQDRPVLGGANSSEVRVHLGGHQNLAPYPRLGDVVSEIGPARGGNAEDAERYEDERKLKVVEAEPRIRLFLNRRAVGVTAGADSRITGVIARDVTTGERTVFSAPLFADCTGDGTVGYLAGADYRIGRESKAETGEPSAVDVADRQTMGASCQWNAVRRGTPVAFPDCPWMLDLSEEATDYALRGDWNWETGMKRDQLFDFETVRDYAMLVAYSNWNQVKNRGLGKAKFADAELAWLAYVAGKRETRRLLGDHVLTEQDVFEERPYEDATCCTTWPIDLHYPMPANQRNFDGEPFRSICTHERHRPYPIPYRCLYSRNVPNLFMAGRDVSVTHVALGTTRVMRTHGMMGEVVGMAASLCHRHGCDPRAIYAEHLDELQALMIRGVGRGTGQPPQDYNCGPCLGSYLPVSTPEAEGVSSRAILGWIEACEKTAETNGFDHGGLHGFVIVRHGRVIAEGSWAPQRTLDEPHMLYSHSKSFTSTAVGLLVDDGKLDLDERVIDIFPDQCPATISENLRALRVRDLLTMNVGADRVDAERDEIRGDWVRAFLANAIERAPGTGFKYDSGATHLLAATVERRSGQRLMDFLGERLFRPLGMTSPWSTVSPTGVACGGWGMNMTTRDMAIFGQFLLQKGEWNGRRILSSEWIDLASARQTWSSDIVVASQTIGSGSDWVQGYGFQFWRCRHGAYRADGAAGQLTVVFPKEDAVVSVHAGLGNMQRELDLIWEHLLPAFSAAPLAAKAADYDELKAKCASLAQPLEDAHAQVFMGMDGATVKRVADGWELVRGESVLAVGEGEWKETEWKFTDDLVETPFDPCGTRRIAATGREDEAGRLVVTWQMLGGIMHGSFAVKTPAQ